MHPARVQPIDSAVGSVEDLVDALAARSGAWVVVERSGRVLAHGAGAGFCPTSLIESLLAKDTAALRASTRWRRSTRPMRGKVQDVNVLVWELAEGARVWLMGGDALPVEVANLAAATRSADQPRLPRDPVVEDLLHPRGPTRGRAPAARLLVLEAEEGLHELARAVSSAVAGTSARLHVEGGSLLVAFDREVDPRCILTAVRRRCSSAVGGLADVSTASTDWALAFRLAHGSLTAARHLGMALGDPADAEIVAELIIAEAAEAVADLAQRLPQQPLDRLRGHDTRTSGRLEESLRAWCRFDFDVPAASAHLQIHQNTMRYRLKRAGQVSGFELGSSRQLLALQLLLTADSPS